MCGRPHGFKYLLSFNVLKDTKKIQGRKGTLDFILKNHGMPKNMSTWDLTFINALNMI
jgi:hypothetical protein